MACRLGAVLMITLQRLEKRTVSPAVLFAGTIRRPGAGAKQGTLEQSAVGADWGAEGGQAVKQPQASEKALDAAEESADALDQLPRESQLAEEQVCVQSRPWQDWTH